MTEMTSNINDLGNVLIRSDLNVPIKNGEITDNFRILKSVEILESILDKSRTITFTSHMGRPNGKELNLSFSSHTKGVTSVLKPSLVLSGNISNKFL